jgi:hypothetical protein
MKILIVGGTIFMALLCATSSCSKKKDHIGIPGVAYFSGKYNCTGYDPYLNQKYTGQIEIVQNESVYDIKMHYSTNDHMIGTGGQYDDQLLFVVFQDQKDLKKVGLEQYQRKGEHTIAGYWTYLGKNKLGEEICEKVG